MSIETIEMWHRRARPNPMPEDFNVQLGCHVEEFAEMLDALYGFSKSFDNAQAFHTLREAAHKVATLLKDGAITAKIDDREGFLDSLADQIVTATGAGYCADMKIAQALNVVNTSNWSKFDENGQPIFDANGKIVKGPKYTPPNLEGLY